MAPLTLGGGTTGNIQFYSSSNTVSSTGNLTLAGVLDINGGGTSDIAGTLNLSGGALSSTGALTITPQAGNNLNIALSTTGDFAVNTNQLYVDTSAGFMGVGTATPGEKLDVVGNATVSGNLTFYGGARTIAGRSAAALTLGDADTGDIQFYSSSNKISSSGNLTLAGVLDINGGGTSDIAGTLNLSGGTLTSTSTLDITPGGALTVGATGQDLTLQGAITNITSTGAGNDITLTSADNIFFDDVRTGAIPFSSVATALTTPTNAIVDAINEAYNAAIGGSGGVWTRDAGTGTLYPTTLGDRVGIGTTTPANIISKLFVTGNTTLTGKAVAIFNQTEAQDIFTASASSTPRLTLTSAGNLQFHQASSITTTTGNLTLDSSANTVLAEDNFICWSNALFPVKQQWLHFMSLSGDKDWRFRGNLR